MILCEWDAPEGDPGQICVHLFARIISTSFASVSFFSVCCYSSVSISMVQVLYNMPVTKMPRPLPLPLSPGWGPRGGDLWGQLKIQVIARSEPVF